MSTTMVVARMLADAGGTMAGVCLIWWAAERGRKSVTRTALLTLCGVLLTVSNAMLHDVLLVAIFGLLTGLNIWTLADQITERERER